MFEQRIQMLQKAFIALSEFQTQYFHSTEFEEASEGLSAAIATDPRTEDALTAAKNTIEVITKNLGINSIKLAES
jgi:hypothetical protein